MIRGIFKAARVLNFWKKSVSRCKEGDNENYYWKLKIEILEENSGFALRILWCHKKRLNWHKNWFFLHDQIQEKRNNSSLIFLHAQRWQFMADNFSQGKQVTDKSPKFIETIGISRGFKKIHWIIMKFIMSHL